MMTLLRRMVSGWVGKLILGLMLGVFAVAWSVADGFSGRASPNTVLTAGGTSVSLQEYQSAYQQSVAQVSQQLQRRPTPEEAEAFGIDQTTLSQLATGAVLDEQGRVLGLGLSEQGLLRLISEDPGFQDAGGNFSREIFRSVLQNAGLTEAAYIERLGDTALRTQIIDSIAQGVAAPQTFASALGLYTGEQRTISTITLEAQPVAEIADPSPEQLETFFTAEAANYAAPEYRSVAYVHLTPETVADPKAVTEEDIAADYEANRENYTTAERRQIQQIVFADQAAADAAAAALSGGATFEDVATAAGRSEADIDLGLLARTEIPDATIADAAFALDEGATSGVVAGMFGPAILRVTQIQPEGVRPLDEVRDELRQQIALDTAGELVDAAYNAFEDARAGGATVEEAAQTASLPIVTVEAIDQNGLDRDGNPVEGLPAADELLPAIFETQVDFDNAPLNYDSNAFVFYDVTEVEDARDRTLDEVRDQVVADWKDAEAQRLLEERAAALKARIEAGEPLEAVAAAEGLTVASEAGLTRATATASLGEAASVAAYSGPAGIVETAPASDPGSRLLLRVDAVTPPADLAAAVPAEQTDQISQTLQNDILQAYVAVLQEEYPVRYNDAAVQAVQAAR